jgi:hypothetical protein
MFMRSVSTVFLLVLAVAQWAPVAATAAELTTHLRKGCVEQPVVSNNDDAGPGSLREAVLLVCAGGTITFDDRFVIDLQSEIVIDKAVIIDGSSVSEDASAGSDTLVQIRGSATNRVFLVDAAGDLSLLRLRLSAGTTDNQGGAVRNLGRLSLFDSKFDGNSAALTSLGGGAIFNAVGATLLVDGCSFDNNQATRGSAIFSSGDAELRNSTFSDNRGTTNEGAIQNRGTLLAVHITVANNGGEGAGFGGLFAFDADTTLVNSIFADNVGNNCFFSGGDGLAIGLLAESGNCAPQFNQDPQLQPLGANGGPTETIALGTSSIALGAGDPEACLDRDQRGVSRLQENGCDLGAFEFVSRVFVDGFE